QRIVTQLCYKRAVPKIVDPVERRLAVAAAVWRVVRRGGLAPAAVPNGAPEGGLSGGPPRPLLPPPARLPALTPRMIMERIERRIAALPTEPDPRRRAELVLAELLPMDAERAAENEVWLAFTARAMVDPELRVLRNEGHDALRAGCRRLVQDLAGPGRPGHDIERETDRLHALVDGLAVHAPTRPATTTPAEMLAIVGSPLHALEHALA